VSCGRCGQWKVGTSECVDDDHPVKKSKPRPPVEVQVTTGSCPSKYRSFIVSLFYKNNLYIYFASFWYRYRYRIVIKLYMKFQLSDAHQGIPLGCFHSSAFNMNSECMFKNVVSDHRWCQGSKPFIPKKCCLQVKFGFAFLPWIAFRNKMSFFFSYKM
jgi:hypothetical protein